MSQLIELHRSQISNIQKIPRGISQYLRDVEILQFEPQKVKYCPIFIRCLRKKIDTRYGNDFVKIPQSIKIFV